MQSRQHTQSNDCRASTQSRQHIQSNNCRASMQGRQNIPSNYPETNSGTVAQGSQHPCQELNQHVAGTVLTALMCCKAGAPVHYVPTSGRASALGILAQ
eukprot:1159713-Pelagomonas_calceolata.AAC.5